MIRDEIEALNYAVKKPVKSDTKKQESEKEVVRSLL